MRISGLLHLLAFALALGGGVQNSWAAQTYVEKDFYFSKAARPHKATIIKGVNMIGRTDPRCKALDPGSADISMKKGTANNPVFYVTCGKEIADTVNVFFSAAEVKAGALGPIAKAIGKGKATSVCRSIARSKAGRPIDWAGFMGTGATEHANGNTTIISEFGLKGSGGTDQRYKIRCLFDHTKIIESVIVPAEG